MNHLFRGCIAAFVLLGCAGQASADVLTANLNEISISGPSSITSVGSVVATDKAGYVDVLVTLLNGATFINTGGPHSPFVYNVSTRTLATSVTPAPVNAATPTTGFIADTANPIDETPYGDFSNGIRYVTYDSKGKIIDAPNGGGHGNPGPLDFHLVGLTVNDFTANSLGNYFGADVIECTGIAGVTCTTGGVAADHVTIVSEVVPGVPEPSTWAMIILGFLGIGFLAHRHKPSKEALCFA
jgi:hypothetical protein